MYAPPPFQHNPPRVHTHAHTHSAAGASTRHNCLELAQMHGWRACRTFTAMAIAGQSQTPRGSRTPQSGHNICTGAAACVMVCLHRLRRADCSLGRRRCHARAALCWMIACLTSAMSVRCRYHITALKRSIVKGHACHGELVRYSLQRHCQVCKPSRSSCQACAQPVFRMWNPAGSIACLRCLWNQWTAHCVFHIAFFY